MTKPAPVNATATGVAMTRRTLLATTMLALASPLSATGPVHYRDRHAPIAARVRDLLARMTLEEKAAQLRCMWGTKPQFLDANGNFSPARAGSVLTNGIGQIARPSDYRGYPRFDSAPFRTIENTVALVNAIQRFLVERTRLGIPALFHEEAAHGLLAGDATIFPVPPALASSWDLGLVEDVFTVAAREARTRGATIALTPVVDLMRDPRWGRSEEFFGEDPHLVGQMGIAAVRGLQGRSRPLAPDRVFATLKHFVHALPQGGLNIGPADVSDRSLRESYLVPFRDIVREAEPAAIMPSYNELGGVPSHANHALLQQIGRNELGFRGAYLSDYDGIGNLETQHHIAANQEAAAITALRAGVQADLPDGASYALLPALVRAGRAPEALVDAAVAQILTLKFEAGLFENPYLDGKLAQRTSQASAHVRLARTAAEKAMVLLRNDGVLPLRPTPGQRIAVIGPNAVEPLYGGYAGDTANGVGILQGLRNQAPAGVTIEHAEGVWITAPDAQGKHRSFSTSPPVSESDDIARIAAAVALAKRSDIVLMVLGDVPAITREAVDWTLPGDRASLGLWGRQDALFEAVADAGKPIVVLLLNGRPLAIPAIAERASALIEGWYLGQEGGNAFADVVFGRVNPGGKLTVSIPRSVGDLPVHYDRHPSAYLNHYLESTSRTLFPFGHGLSYTRFEISAPRLSAATIRQGADVAVAVDVANVGDRTGDEVVQLYIRDQVSSVPRPVLELRGFRRVTLAPGEKRTLTFGLTADDLAFFDADMKWTVEPGAFTISVGPSSAALKSAILVAD